MDKGIIFSIRTLFLKRYEKHLVAQKGHHAVIVVLTTYDTVNAQTLTGETPLHYSVQDDHLEASRSLLTNGANPNVTGRVDRTMPLHTAAEKGKEELVRLLKASGALVTAQNHKGELPLHLAAQKGHHVVILILATRDTVNARTRTSETPLHHSVQEGHLEASRSLLSVDGVDVNARTSAEETPLHIATTKQDVNTVHLLLTKAPDCKAKNIHGNTVLHNAVMARNGVLTRKFSVSDFGILDESNKEGETAIHYCIRNEYDEGVEILLQSRPKPNLRLRNNNRFTPFHYAILKKNLKVVKLLYSCDQNVINDKFPDELTPLQTATNLNDKPMIDFLNSIRV